LYVFWVQILQEMFWFGGIRLVPFVWAIAFLVWALEPDVIVNTNFGGIGLVLPGQLLFGCYLLVVIGKYSS